MSKEIIICILSGLFTLIGTIVTCLSTLKVSNTKMEVNQAKTDVKLENLTNEVRKHNNFGERIPVIEERQKEMREKIENVENRVTQLERK